MRFLEDPHTDARYPITEQTEDEITIIYPMRYSIGVEHIDLTIPYKVIDGVIHVPDDMEEWSYRYSPPGVREQMEFYPTEIHDEEQ